MGAGADTVAHLLSRVTAGDAAAVALIAACAAGDVARLKTWEEAREVERRWQAERIKLYLAPLLTLGNAAHRSQALGLFPLEGERAHVAVATYERLSLLDQIPSSDEEARGRGLSLTRASDFTVLAWDPEKGFHLVTTEGAEHA